MLTAGLHSDHEVRKVTVQPSVDIPDAVSRIAHAVSAGDLKVYIAGGAVRNSLLGLPAADYDLCGPQSADVLRRAAAGDGIEISGAVNGLGTAIVAAGGEKFEYTAFRTDSYAPGGAHRPVSVSFTDDIALDALRRDFTVNALYADAGTGEVIDPTGRGLADLARRVLAMVRPETFEEDALRILRLVRFASELGFRIEPKTLDAARKNARKIESLSAERIRDEFFGIIMSDVPYGRLGAPAKGLMMLRDIGALRYIVPQLEEGEGCRQSPRYHRYDVLNHQIAVCALTPPDIRTRLAGLMHDIAKPEAQREDGNMHRHAQLGEVRVKSALRALNVPNDIVSDTAKLVRTHMFDLENNARVNTVRKRIMTMGPEQFLRLCDLREADFAGSGMGHDPKSARKWRRVLRQMEEEHAPLSVRDLDISGTDLMRELGVKPGPEIGLILKGLLEHASAHPDQNSYKCLLKYARMLKDGALKVPVRQTDTRRTQTEDHKGV